jgi:hypothetical protein
MTYKNICSRIEHHLGHNLDGGQTISWRAAVGIEARMGVAPGIMLDEVAPLQWAIANGNESAIAGVLSYVKHSVCP